MIRPLPRWTTELREVGSGVDHLGLGVVSNQLLGIVAPDLYVLTLHPGYHSFYAFVLDEFWRRDLPRSQRAWQEFYRSKELIFSVAGNMCAHPAYNGNFRGIVGSGKTSGFASRAPEDGYATDLNYIKHALGGYGRYYRSVMASMGVIYPQQDTSYPVDLPTDLGKELAAEFRARIAETSYWRQYFDKASVPTDVVREYGQVACLCRLREAAPDLGGVRDVVLHHGKPASAASRRSSLRMLLHIAANTDGYALSETAFRQLIYFGRTGDGARWVPPETDPATPSSQLSTLDTWRRWRIYQAREFYAFGLDSLWRWLVEWGLMHGGDSRPLPIEDAIAALQIDVDGNALLGSLGGGTPDMDRDAGVGLVVRNLRRLAGEPDVFPESDGAWPDREFRLDAPLSEWSLFVAASSEGEASPKLATAALALLMLTATRFDHLGQALRPEWSFARAGGTQRLSFDRFIGSLRAGLAARLTLGEFAAVLLRDSVIAQHIRVANGKLPYNTFRFVQEGTNIRFFARSRDVGLNSARFDTLSHHLSDLDFAMPLALASHPLTTAGFELLETGEWTAGA